MPPSQMNCNSCGVAVPVTVAYCPACGASFSDKRWAGETGALLVGIRWVCRKLGKVILYIGSILLTLGMFWVIIRFIRWAWDTPIF